MFKNIFILISLILITTCLVAQASSDIFPAMLQKEIKKVAGEKIIINELTLPTEMSLQYQSGKFYTISTTTVTQTAKYVYLGKVNTCRAGGCSIKREQPNDSSSEFFEYFIVFDSTGTIRQVKIYNYQATHGHEITSKNWLKQFINYKGGENLLAGKNIDAISGATISVDAITFDIEYQTIFLKKIIDTVN
jgi:Na+-translocating ferredoxin:NAD+ oxidoreductase RnfG subunit